MARAERELSTKVNASARFVRMSPYKVREVAALIKGKPIDEARRILAFTPKSASREVAKVLEAAIANAENNFQIPQEELFVKIASADEGMTIKRFRPRAQGRGFRIRKRTCHINLTLERTPEAIRALLAPPGDARRRRAAAKPTTKPATKPATKKSPQAKAETSAKSAPKAKAAKSPKATAKPEVSKDKAAESDAKAVEVAADLTGDAQAAIATTTVPASVAEETAAAPSGTEAAEAPVEQPIEQPDTGDSGAGDGGGEN